MANALRVSYLAFFLGFIAQPVSAETFDQIADDTWKWTLQKDISAQIQYGIKDLTFPRHGTDESSTAAGFAQSILDRLNKIKIDDLPHDDQITARIIQSRMNIVVEDWTYYWHKPVLTAYQMGFTINAAHGILKDFGFTAAEDLARYDNLLAGYLQWLKDAETRSAGKVERGLSPSQAALPGIRATMLGLKAAVAGAVTVSDERLAKLGLNQEQKSDFAAKVSARLKDIDSQYDALLTLLDTKIAASAPAGVGMGQYEGGDAYYAYLARLYTSTDYTPQQLHEIGLQNVRDIEARMAKIRNDIGFTGSHKDFLETLKTDPQFIAKTAEDAEAQYNSYIARIEPILGQYFHQLPKAPYRVARLVPELEKSVTYGFYKQPEPADPYGTYYYNGGELANRPMVVALGLMYHELLPGHHFQIARQIEDENLHPLRKSISLDSSAYTEGWAEYAASTLSREMGLYRTPYEEYGRLLMDMFFAVRITVDTGMNAMGWPLEKARQFMADRLITSQSEVDSESLRYSTDIPGQSMAYGIGSRQILEMREEMRKTLGAKFDIRDFHEAVLSVGAAPLPVLRDHLHWTTEQAKR